MRAALEELAQLPEVRVLVVGDLMLDRYAWGHSTRMSPEAPVPVVDIDREETRPGGAANVVANLIALGARVDVVGAVGDDFEGRELLQHLRSMGAGLDLVRTVEGRPTTVKTRIITPEGHLMRLDREAHSPLFEVVPEQWTAFDYDVVILQDYNKGMLHTQSIQALTEVAAAHGVPVAVDPKFDHFRDFGPVALFKPNRKELQAGLGVHLNPTAPDFQSSLEQARQTLDCDRLMVSLSEDGIAICSGSGVQVFPADFNSIVDVSGAGDTVMAVAALGLVLGWSDSQMAAVSSYCGGWTCQFQGVVAPDIQKILDTLPS